MTSLNGNIGSYDGTTFDFAIGQGFDAAGLGLPAPVETFVGFTKSAAAYYAPHDIRLNVIAPALVETPMAERAA